MTAIVPPRSLKVRELGLRPGTQLVALLVIVLIVGVLLEPALLSERNIYALLQNSLAPLIIALGASVALYAGIPDLSVGSVVGATAMLFAVTLQATNSLLLATVVALAGGILIGLINGIAVVNFGADPLVVTLGTLAALRGLTFVIGGNSSIIATSAPLQAMTAARVGPIPILFILVIAIYAVVSFHLSRSRLGRHIQAIGGSEEAARRAGISVNGVKRLLLVLTAVLSAFAALIYLGQLSAAPITLGVGLELQIYAAILISGFSLTNGGIGNPMVTVAGLLLLTTISSLLSLENVPLGWQNVITGAILAGAVTIDVHRRKNRFE